MRGDYEDMRRKGLDETGNKQAEQKGKNAWRDN